MKVKTTLSCRLSDTARQYLEHAASRERRSLSDYLTLHLEDLAAADPSFTTAGTTEQESEPVTAAA